MSSNAAKKSVDSVNDILTSIKNIIEENNVNNNALPNNATEQNFSANYALQGYQSQADYLLKNHPNFKNYFDNEHKGVEVVTVDDALDNLARQIGIQSTNNLAKEDNNLNKVFNNYSDTSDLTYKDLKTEKISSPIVNSTEDLILKSAMEEVNNRLRVVIAKWYQDNLPSLVKQIINEEMTKILKNIKL